MQKNLPYWIVSCCTSSYFRTSLLLSMMFKQGIMPRMEPSKINVEIAIRDGTTGLGLHFLLLMCAGCITLFIQGKKCKYAAMGDMILFFCA